MNNLGRERVTEDVQTVKGQLLWKNSLKTGDLMNEVSKDQQIVVTTM